jgi:acetylornithine/N-succinyldiaminopimelate aminotransferase
MQNSFHGRTLAMLAATGQTKVQKGYDPLPLGFAYAEFNNLDAVRAQVNERTVAVMVEPVQGEGGVMPADKAFLQGLRKLCDEKGLLLLCDEIQCGLGRTGSWFAWQRYDVQPDAFTLAKGLASGVPMGALVAAPKLSDVFKKGSHGSTFGGNPLACAAALATIDIIEQEGLLKRAEEAGRLFREGLQPFVDKYEAILAVRGEGLMVGLVLEGPAKTVVDKCREMGLLCCAAGENVVRFLPPLTVKDDELEEALDILDEALEMLFGDEAEGEGDSVEGDGEKKDGESAAPAGEG